MIKWLATMPTLTPLAEDIKYLDEAQRQSAGEGSDCVEQECHFASNMSTGVCVCLCVGSERRREVETKTQLRESCIKCLGLMSQVS